MKAKRNISIRHKVGKIIAIFSLIIIIFYTGVMAFLLDWGLANGAGGVVWQESRLFLEAYEKDQNTPLPKGRSVNGYIGVETLPTSFTDIFPAEAIHKKVGKTKSTMYAMTEDSEAYRHHNIMVSRLPDSEKLLIVHYELIIPKNLEFDVWDTMYYTAIAGGVLVIFMLLIFRRLLQHSLTPLLSLSRWIDRIEENKAPTCLPEDISDDEIGQVATSLFDALERINISNEREKQFLRNASHELRTPIAIIRNTMDVIEYKRKKGNTDIESLLTRIRRASDTMKAVTEAILWLAIENYSPPSQHETDLKKLVDVIIQENQSLLENKNVTLNINTEKLKEELIEKALIHIVLDNLIRNAFQHTTAGTIDIISTSATGIEIKNNRCDTEKAIPDKNISDTMNTGGFGLGLALVQKISQKMNWDFSFEVENGQATARLEI